MNTLSVRAAEKKDCVTIFQFIRELAIFEKEESSVITTVEKLQENLFSNNPKAFALMCEHNAKPVGFALYFYNYSTWLGQYGLYLEDLYIIPEARNQGASKVLLEKLAHIAHQENCGRIEWSVLNWNTPAIKMYESIGAKPQDEWTRYRLDAKDIEKMVHSKA